MSLFPTARHAFLTNQVSLLTDTINVALVSTTSPSFSFSSSFQFLSSIPSANRVATATLASKAIDATGKFTAANITFPALTGAPIVWVVIYKDAGSDATSQLLDYNNKPLTPAGVDATITWGSTFGALRLYSTSGTQFYQKFITACMTASAPDLLTGNIKAVCVDSADYTPNLAAHEFLSDIPSGARISPISGNLTGKTLAAAIFDADDTLFTSMTGDTFEYVILFEDTGTESTSRLIGIITAGSNLPFAPNGTNAIAQWQNSGNRILTF